MNKARLRFLFKSYFDKTASPEERAELADLIGMEHLREEVMLLLGDTWENYEREEFVLSEHKAEEILKEIFRQSDSGIPEESTEATNVTRIRKMGFGVRIAAAASVLFVITGSYLLWRAFEDKGGRRVQAKASATDIRPGVFKASLILGDGSRITLDSAGPGQLAQQGDIQVVNNNGSLRYKQNGERGGAVLYNTLATGKGQTYSFSLVDGSKVWLNSGSSIHFPVSFYGKERRVDITGEVFVEVAKDPSKTFVVTVNGMEVRALGTSFDINAYSDEEHIRTTLVDGAVKVAQGGEATVLHPGQQTSLQKDGHLSEPVNADVDEIVSWKEGNFQFDNADIRTILRQFARWYDVEVVYDGPVNEGRYFGLVSRSSTLTSVLQMFRDSDISFRIEGQKLYVKTAGIKK